MRDFVVIADDQPLARIVGRVTSVAGEIVWIDSARPVPAVLEARCIVYCVAPGVRGQEAKTVSRALVQTHLQRVVTGYSVGRLHADALENTPRGVLSVRGIVKLLKRAIRHTVRIRETSRRSRRSDGVSFIAQFEVTAQRSNVANLQNSGARQFPLNIEIKVHRVRRGKIRARSTQRERSILQEIDVSGALRRSRIRERIRYRLPR